MPPEAFAVTVIGLPFITESEEIAEAFVKGLITSTVKYFFSIWPVLSLTLTQISYFTAAAGLMVTTAFSL